MASHTHGAHAVAAGIPSGERFRRNGAAGIFSRERSKQNIAASEAFAAETAENGGKTVVFCTDIGECVLSECTTVHMMRFLPHIDSTGRHAHFFADRIAIHSFG